MVVMDAVARAVSLFREGLLCSQGVQVYIRSRVIAGQLTSLMYSYDLHYHLEQNYRGVYDTLRAQGWMKGRALDERTAALLSLVERVAERLGGVEVYDVSSFRGRVKALWSGVWRVPTVVVEGERHVGAEKSEKALRGLAEVGDG